MLAMGCLTGHCLLWKHSRNFGLVEDADFAGWERRNLDTYAVPVKRVRNLENPTLEWITTKSGDYLNSKPLSGFGSLIL